MIPGMLTTTQGTLSDRLFRIGCFKRSVHDRVNKLNKLPLTDGQFLRGWPRNNRQAQFWTGVYPLLKTCRERNIQPSRIPAHLIIKQGRRKYIMAKTIEDYLDDR